MKSWESIMIVLPMKILGNLTSRVKQFITKDSACAPRKKFIITCVKCLNSVSYFWMPSEIEFAYLWTCFICATMMTNGYDKTVEMSWLTTEERVLGSQMLLRWICLILFAITFHFHCGSNFTTVGWTHSRVVPFVEEIQIYESVIVVIKRVNFVFFCCSTIGEFEENSSDQHSTQTILFKITNKFSHQCVYFSHHIFRFPWDLEWKRWKTTRNSSKKYNKTWWSSREHTLVVEFDFHPKIKQNKTRA